MSKRQENILNFMKLSLEANLIPKTHVAGGYADKSKKNRNRICFKTFRRL